LTKKFTHGLITDTYVLTVTNVNDAPTVTSAISDVSTAEDAAYLLNAASTCTDVDADDTLSYTISGAPSTITATTAGVISGTPVNADVGAHTITVTCTDDSSAATSATNQYVLTVTNVNDAPTFTSTADTTAPEDVAYAYIVTATDTEGEAITLTGTTIPSWASFVDLGSGSGVLSGTPTNSDVTSGFEVTLTATDASNAAGTQVFDIVVSNVNDVATISGASTGSVTEDASTPATGTPTVSDDDAGENTLQDVSAGTDSVSGYGTYGVSSGTWTYTLDDSDSTVNALAASASLSDTFVVTSSDGGTTMTVTLTITGADDASVWAGTSTGSVTEDASATTATGALTITDVDGSPTITDVSSTAGANGYGNFVMASGTWTYTIDNSAAATTALDAGDSVTDTYAFPASDSTTQTVTVTISGADDASVWAGTSTGSVTEDASATTATGALTITDADGDDTPTITPVSSTAGANGYGNFVMASGT
jgi:VCBS repeat-containing protein